MIYKKNNTYFNVQEDNVMFRLNNSRLVHRLGTVGWFVCVAIDFWQDEKRLNDWLKDSQKVSRLEIVIRGLNTYPFYDTRGNEISKQLHWKRKEIKSNSRIEKKIEETGIT